MLMFPGRPQASRAMAVVWFVFALMAAALPAGAAEEVLYAAIPQHFPPQYITDGDGRPSGFAIEILDAVASRAGFRVEYRSYDGWPRTIQAVRDGTADVVPSVGLVGDRHDFLAFTQPVEVTAIALFVRHDSIAIRGLDDLAGRRVGVVPNSAGAELLDGRPGVLTVSYPSYLENLFALISGRVDAIVQPEPVTWALARDGRLSGEIRTVGPPLTSVKRAIAMREGDERLARLDAAIPEVLRSAAYRDIYARWYGEPEPFWTAARVAVIMGAALLLSVAAAGGWRYRTMVELSRRQARLNAALGALCGCNHALARAGDERQLLAMVCKVVGESLVARAVAVRLEGQDSLAAQWPEDAPAASNWTACLPLMAEGTRLGTLCLCHDGRHRLDGGEADLLSRLADDIGFGILALRHRDERRRADLALRDSEERYRSLVDNLTDFVWEIDADHRYTYVSARAQDILGYAPAELLGRTPFDLMPPDEAVRIEDEFTVLTELRLPIQHIENINVARDGRMVVLESSGMPMQDGQGGLIGYRGVARDITERKRAEAALMWEADVRGVFAELGRLLLTSIPIEQVSRTVVERGCRLIGAQRGCACHSDPETGRPICATPVDFAYATLCGGTAQTDQPCTDFDDGASIHRQLSVPVTVGGRPVGRLTFGGPERPFEPRDREIAERLADIYSLALRRAQDEKALIESRAKLETVTAATQDGIVMLDEHGRIDFWNAAAARIFGRSEAEVLGQPLCGMLAGDTSALCHGDPLAERSLEVEGRRQDGSAVPLEITVVATRLGQKSTAVATVKDLTERKEAERLRLEIEKRTFQAQKMDALGTLAGGIAHNFNNMLMPVMVLTELTMNDMPADWPGRKRLEAVLQASRRARDLVQRILTFGRQDNPTMQPLNLSEVVAEGLELLRSALPRSIEVREHLEDLPAPVLADRGQLLTVLMNLGSNAADAMEGTTGVLEVTLTAAATVPEDSSLPAGLYARLSVRDTGHGMDEATLRRVFEPFFTTKGVGRGTGLGLATSQAIVAAHGGCIQPHSTPGQGTVLDIWLPLVAEAITSTAERRCG